MVKISAVIITLNEENNIERCIRSVQRVADEILVVDSFSTDKTEQICKELGVRFIQHEFEGFRDQKNYAISQAIYDYILALDADEALSVELEKEVLDVKNNWKFDGYRFFRLNNYCGKWILHTDYYPEKRIRLFDRRKGKWHGANIHEVVKMAHGATVATLKGHLLHWRYQSYEEHINEVNLYSTISAKEYYKMGVKAGYFKILFHTSWRFIHSYFFRRGFLSGFNGLVISSLLAKHCFLKYAKLRKLYKINRKRQPFPFLNLLNMPVGNKPLTSVIITTYNQPEWLRKTLWGFEHQTEKRFEVLIADDGSGDETKQVVDEFKSRGLLNIIHVWHPDNGFQKCQILNKAILKTNSDYLIFTDGDCIPRRDFVEVHISNARRGKFLSGGYLKLVKSVSANISYTDIQEGAPFISSWLMKNGQPFTYKFLKLTQNPFIQKILNAITTTRPTWNGHNVSGWKDDIISVNGYNEDMQYGGLDRELGERLMNYGIKGKQIRYSAICVHLDHPRPYRTKSTWDKNYRIRKEVKRKKLKWTSNGIDKYIQL
ncbi:glycosyltransferase family 2 protein [Tenuifilum osseticum]|uniref:glycosyltransferase family 2 protein n=1 Tax=Tenuifilum osseticum TaxID=3374723 RepID=UPI0034E4DEEF